MQQMEMKLYDFNVVLAFSWATFGRNRRLMGDMRHVMRTKLNFLFLTAAITLPAFCQDGDLVWQGKLAPGDLLKVQGVNGTIRATGNSGDTATITARKTGTKSDPAEVGFQIVQFVGGVAICPIYPDGNGKPPNACGMPGEDTYVSANNNDVQVEFTLTVPQGVNLIAHTVLGNVDATSLTGDVDAASLTGDITVSTTGSVTARTLKGKVVVTMGSTSWQGLKTIDTGEGNIDVTLPFDANVRVQASAFRGRVSSDFPLAMSGNSFGGMLGKGTGPSLRLSTFEGDITVHQQ